MKHRPYSLSGFALGLFAGSLSCSSFVSGQKKSLGDVNYYSDQTLNANTVEELQAIFDEHLAKANHEHALFVEEQIHEMGATPDGLGCAWGFAALGGSLCR